MKRIQPCTHPSRTRTRKRLRLCCKAQTQLSRSRRMPLRGRRREMRGKRKSVKSRSSTSLRRRKASVVSIRTRCSFPRKKRNWRKNTRKRWKVWSLRWWTLKLDLTREFKNSNSRSQTSEKTMKLLMLWKLLMPRSLQPTSRSITRSTMSFWQINSTVRTPLEPNLSKRRKPWSKNGKLNWMKQFRRRGLRSKPQRRTN